VYGLFAHGNTSANFVPVNSADNVLHVALGVGMLALGFALGRQLIATDRSAAPA
jgi:hypothetical protein